VSAVICEGGGCSLPGETDPVAGITTVMVEGVDRVAFHDHPRLTGSPERLMRKFAMDRSPEDDSSRIERHGVSRRADQGHPELAETVFDSACGRLLQRADDDLSGSGSWNGSKPDTSRLWFPIRPRHRSRHEIP